jgi:hypothetical protein
MSDRSFDCSQGFSTECGFLFNEELIVVLKSMEITYSICYRDYTNTAHISAAINFWTYVHWEFLLL